MGLRQLIARRRGGKEARSGVDTWLSNYLIPANSFGYNGHTYATSPYGLVQTLSGNRSSEVLNTLPGYAAALRTSPPAFAAQMVRALVLSQARFTFRNRPSSGKAPRTFGTRALSILERPWPNGTTGELLSRMEWHAGLAGNAYVLRQPDRLRVLRPDWIGIVFGSHQDPDDAAYALDGQVIGYVYQNGGLYSGRGTMVTLLPDEIAHWCPLPDPEASAIGMSWLTPAIRDVMADRVATEHKLKFFENGATPNMIVKGIPAATAQQFNEIVDMLESRHAGAANAYRTLYLTVGADASVVGSDLKQLDFKATQGAGETRIALLSRVPAPILGIAEGLAGSSLNAGNFGMARRIFADSWVYPTLQDLAGALASIVDVPADSELWFDAVDIPLLREDRLDAARIGEVEASTISQYVREGFTPESAIAAVRGQDVTLLKHTNLVSVQLQPPGVKPQPQNSFRDDDDDDDEVRAAIGDDSLHHYWTKGKGLAKWAKSPHPWTSLYNHLKKHVGPARAKRMAAAWHKEVFGIWPGEKKGDNPLGPG